MKLKALNQQIDRRVLWEMDDWEQDILAHIQPAESKRKRAEESSDEEEMRLFKDEKDRKRSL